MMNLLTVQLCLMGWYYVLCPINAANIIVAIPVDIKSHLQFSEAVVKTLLNAGHHVTYITSILPSKPLGNCSIIDFRDDSQEKPLQFALSLRTGWWIYIISAAVENFGEKFCFSGKMKKTLSHLKSSGNKYDALIVPGATYPKCFMPIAKEFDIPIIAAVTTRSASYADDLVGNPRSPSDTPFEYTDFYTKHSFWNRLVNSFNEIIHHLINYNAFEEAIQDPRFQKHFPDFGPSQTRVVSLLFYNNHHSIFSRPVTPNTIELGGLHISPVANALPENIKKFIDEAKHGVIYFSLGSLVEISSLNSEVKNILLNVFGRLPQRVIWKCEENFVNLPENILTLKWLPQRDILAHKNVEVFITHCGLFGIQEAIYEGKPLVMIPLGIDQPGTASILYQKGVGEYLDFKTLTKENLLAAINKVLNYKSYEDKMQQLSRAYRDRPMTPQKSLVYWTEYVIRHKGALHLRTVGADLLFYQYYSLDVIFFVLFVCFGLVWSCYFLLTRFLNRTKPYIRNREKNRKYES